MFIASEHYEKEIRGLITRGKEIWIAVAFWGRGSEKYLLEQRKKSFKVICNLSSGGTNPEPIRLLLKLPHVKIKALHSLHAKAVIGEHEAIVGSANFSTNGLNHESDEDPGWEEAALRTNESSQIDSLRVWFGKLWDNHEAVEITGPDDPILQRAQEIWDSRRKTRVDATPNKGLLDRPLESLKDREIYLAINEGWASPAAKDAFNDVINSLPEDGKRKYTPKNLEYFEGATKWPLNAWLISVHRDSRAGITIRGVYRRVPELDPPEGTIQIVVRKKRILGYHFGPRDREELRRRISAREEVILKKWKKLRWLKAIPLYEALKDGE